MHLEELKQKFFNFYKQRGYKIQTECNIVPLHDESMLFVTAGMVQFKDYYTGKKHTDEKYVSCQTCVRLSDLEIIGTTDIHRTSFNMLGAFNFNLQDKKTAILEGLDLLLHLGFEKNALTFTAHPDDLEALKALEEIAFERSIGVDKILHCAENLWSMGISGPCGFCSEIFFGETELLNSVFMNMIMENGQIVSTTKQAKLDMGMGLERTLASLLGVGVYEIPSVKHEIERINLIAPLPKEQTRMLFDHLETIKLLVKNEILPNNKGRGYVLRKMIRKLTRVVNSKHLKLLLKEEKLLLEIMLAEFAMYEKCKNRLQKLDKNQFFNTETILDLQSTYGIPVEETIEFFKQHNISYFLEEAKPKHKFVQVASNTPEYKIASFQSLVSEPKQMFEATIVGVKGNKVKLDEHCFYVEGGGQVGSRGVLETKNQDEKFKVLNVTNDGLLLENANGLEVGVQVKCYTDMDHLNGCKKHHSALHIFMFCLRAALQTVVLQTGSLVEHDFFRIDVLTYKTKEEINSCLENVKKHFEQIVKNNSSTKAYFLECIEAQKRDVVFLKDFNYGEKVRVVEIGPSKEACCGTHVETTKEINKIIIEPIISLAMNKFRLKCRII